MRARQSFAVLVSSWVVLAGGLALHGQAASEKMSWSPSPEERALAERKVEPELLARLRRDAPSDLVVVMRERPDLTAAYAIADWEERGRFVYETLRRAAEVSQARVCAYAEASGFSQVSFFSSNCVILKAAGAGSGRLIEAALDLAALPEVALVRAPRVFFPDPAGIEIGGVRGAPGWNLGPLDPAQGQYGMQAQQVWSQFGIRGEGIVVASIDSGVYYQHEALDRQYRGNLGGILGGPYNHDYCWYDPDGSLAPVDAGLHGTAVTGILVGENPSGTERVGVAPGARWIACNGCPHSCPEEHLNACADWMLAPCPIGISPGSPSCDPDRRPHVVNNSWGSETCTTYYRDSVEAWRAAGIFPAFAAGNTESCSSLGAPGSLVETFASAAHDSAGANLYAGGPSCQAPIPSCGADDHQVKPNLNAPAVVRTADSEPGAYLDGFNGTSSACPHTAGAVALLWSANPGYIGQIGETYKILEQSTNRAVPGGSCGNPACAGGEAYPNYEYGWGYLDALGAIRQATAGSGTLAGTVTGGGQPVANALVRVQAASSHRDYRTDAQGHYAAVLLAGPYTVTVTKYLFVTQTAQVQVIQGQALTRDFSLDAAAVHGVSGTVTEARTGEPLSATITVTGTPSGPPSPDDVVRTDGASGFYRISLVAGNTYTFSVAAGAGGYQTASRTFGPLEGDRREDFALVSFVVSGTVTDARSHWPLYAKITVTGTPAGPPSPDNEFWTDPATGAYSMKLAEGNTYTLTAAARAEGYQAGTATLGPLAADRVEDFALPADEGKCAAPGYAYTYGFFEDFESADGGFAGGGTSPAWAWGTPSTGPLAGHSGSRCWGTTQSAVSAINWIVSPVIDLSAAAGRSVTLFWWDWFRNGGKASVRPEVSADGGATWENPLGFSRTGNWNWSLRSATLQPAYATAGFRVRFVYSCNSAAAGASYWVDDVFLAVGCDPGPGGIVAGTVTNLHSGAPVGAATVSSATGAATTGPDGFYTLYLAGGPVTLTASKAGAGYGSVSREAAVTPGAATVQDFALPAGSLVCPSRVSVSVGLGQKVSQQLPLSNAGEYPLQFLLVEGESSLAPGGRTGGSGDGPEMWRGLGLPASSNPPREGVPEGWEAFTPIPAGPRRSAAAESCDGQSLYLFGGLSASGAYLNEAWEYHASGDFWCPLAPMPKALFGAEAACIGGKVYVVGGYDGTDYSADLLTYDTVTDTWTTAPAPVPFSPMAAAHSGKLYTFGGYRRSSSALVRAKETWTYDPETRLWGRWADMPVANAAGKAVVAGSAIFQVGGSGWGGSESRMVQRYDPSTNTWDGSGPQLQTGRISLAAAWYGDKIYAAGGYDPTSVAILGTVETYDPSLWPSGAWTTLGESIPVPVGYMAGACAASRLWLQGGRQVSDALTDANQALDDGGACHYEPPAGLPWLSESPLSGTLLPGGSQDATLTFDAGVPEIPGTGVYQGLLKVATDSPGGLALVTVQMEVVEAACTLDCGAAAPTSAGAGAPVAFEATATAAGCTGAPSFAWAFGDGQTSAEQNPSHTYAARGDFAWTLTVSADGQTCRRAGSVSVSGGVPGDCDGNGSVSIGEVQKAINMFLGIIAPACGVDCNGNGIIAIGEVQKVINAFLGFASQCS